MSKLFGSSHEWGSAAVAAGAAGLCYLLPVSPDQKILLWSAVNFAGAIMLYPRPETDVVVEDEVESSPDVIDSVYTVITPGPVVTPVAEPTKTVLPKNFYDAERIALQYLLNETHKIPCELDDQIVLAPTFVGYVLRDQGAVSYDRLDKISSDLARQLNQHTRKNRGGEINILVSNSQPIVLQVTRAKMTDLRWSDRPNHSKPMSTLVGRSWHGLTVQDVSLDVYQDTLMSGAFIGMQGSGKTVIANLTLLGLLRNTSPDQLLVYASDTKENSFEKFRGLPHFRAITGDVDEAMAILREFAYWCTPEGRPQDGTYRLLILDEARDLFTHEEYGKEALDLFRTILAKGRSGSDPTSAKLRCWTIIQDPNKINYPPDLKRLTWFTITAYTKSDGYLKAQLDIYGANKIIPQREAIISSPFHPDMRFATYQLFDDDLYAEAKRNNPKLLEPEILKIVVAQMLKREIANVKAIWGNSDNATKVAVDQKQPKQTKTIIVEEEEVEEDDDMNDFNADDLVKEMVTDFVKVDTIKTVIKSEGQKYVPVSGLPSRRLTEAEKYSVRKLAASPEFQRAGKPNVSKLVERVYAGARSADKTAWIQEALDEQ